MGSPPNPRGSGSAVIDLKQTDSLSPLCFFLSTLPLEYSGVGTVDANVSVTHQYVTTAGSAISDRLVLILLLRLGVTGANVQQERVERRKFRRFQVPIGAFIVLGPDSTKVGRITDVGLGGLGFCPVDKKMALDGVHEFDMFHVNNGFNLKKIQFQTIWDLEFRKGVFGLMTTRRTGIQFEELTCSQRSRVEHFILNYTTAGYLDHPDLLTRPRQAHGLAPIGP